MQETSLRRDSLVLYKNRPARVMQMGKKLEIEVDGGQTLSVRPKDVTLLHPGPLTDLTGLTTPEGEIRTAWELLTGETTSLNELAELAYGEFTPASAWATWQLIADGLYFSGSPETVAVHTAEAVAAEVAAREARAAEEQAWNDFVARTNAGQYRPEDERYLEEVAALALGRQERSRVLRGLGKEESPQSAHALLLALGYWDATVNPYPQRLGVPLTIPEAPLPALPQEPRRDLTHLLALAIDDEGNRDPDDAVSLEDGRLWVHVADVAALVPPDSAADLEARNRGANLYLPEVTVPMLPTQATAVLGLGLAEVSPALSFAMRVGPAGEISDLEIVPSWIRVTRLTYEEAEARIEEPPLWALYKLAQVYQARRQRQGAIELELPEVRVVVEDGLVSIRPLPSRRSRDLVREAMLMTGEAVARFAIEREIALPFTAQDAPDVEVAPVMSTAAMFAMRRNLRPGQQQSVPAPHAGLGMEMYVQCTSPLRRYLDLVAHQQLRAYLRGVPPLDTAAVMERVGAAGAVIGDLRRAERLSLAHWTLVYLLRHPDWRGEGIIVEKRGARDVVLIPDLALETQLYQRQSLPLDGVVSLALNAVDLAGLDVNFRVEKEKQ